MFVDMYTTEYCPEWRLTSALGFGGKLHHDNHKGFCVGCYSEDMTDERRAMIDSVNLLLKEI